MANLNDGVLQHESMVENLGRASHILLVPTSDSVGEPKGPDVLDVPQNIMLQNSWIALRKNGGLLYVHYFCEAQ